MVKQDAVKFSSQAKYEHSLYKDFHASHFRLDMPLCDRFFKEFSKETGFNTKLYGIDIIVDQQSGTHYIIDLNYFPGYKETPRSDLKINLDNMIRKQIAIQRGDYEEEEEDEESKSTRIVKYAMGLSAIAVITAAIYKSY